MFANHDRILNKFLEDLLNLGNIRRIRKEVTTPDKRLENVLDKFIMYEV